MKKFLFAAFFALMLPFTASAETVRLGADGSISIENPGGDRKIEVTFDDGILDDRDAWKAAIRNPGVVVPVTSHVKAERSGFFHIKKTTIIDTGVLYDGAGSITAVRDVALPSEMEFALFLILAFMSISLVSIAHYGIRLKNTEHFEVRMFATSALTFLFFVSSTQISLDFDSPSFFVFSLVSIAALILLLFNPRKKTRAFALYYFSMLVNVGAFLLS